MKYKKGGPITSLDDLAGELFGKNPVFYKEDIISNSILTSVDLLTVFKSVENRNFYYAVEDPE